MKLSEYIKSLQQLELEHGPDIELIYCIDDEGNGYCKGVYCPSIRYIEPGYHIESAYEEDSDYVKESSNLEKVVLIN